MIPAALQRLTAALEALPDGGRPHVVEVVHEPAGAVVRTITGARFELVFLADSGAVDLDAVDARVREGVNRWAAEPYDVYRVQRDDVAAVEVRSLAGESVLDAVVAVQGGALGIRVVQDDAARWQAEEAGLIGEEFQDFAERNAAWAGLGGTRPRGWVLTVVEPGEPWPTR